MVLTSEIHKFWVKRFEHWRLMICHKALQVFHFFLTLLVRVNIMSGSCIVICMLFLFVYFAVWTIFFSLIMQQRKLLLCDIIRCLWFKPQAPHRPLRENTINAIHRNIYQGSQSCKNQLQFSAASCGCAGYMEIDTYFIYKLALTKLMKDW